MATKFIPNKISEDSVPITTAVDGNIYFTSDQNLYIANGTGGGVTKITDIKTVNVLPSTPKLNKLYLLSTNKSINVWDGNTWASYGAVNFTLQPPTSTTLGGVKSGGNGLTIDTSGLASINNGIGLKFDLTGKLVPDESAIDITQLKNYSTLSIGSPQGFIDGSTTLATFANAQKGSFWICSSTTTITIGTIQLSCNDQLWCKTTVTGTPTELSTNFVKVPYTLVQASPTAAGAVKISSTTPLMNSTTPSAGSSDACSRSDHVHPSDSTKVNKVPITTTNGIAIYNNNVGDLKDSAKLLPSGNIVGTTDAQTLTNKTLSDSTTVINNATDVTKGVKFDTVGNTTGIIGTVKTKFTTAKTVELPDASGTLMIAPEVTELKILENKNLVENMVYEVTSTAVAGSVYTLPTSASRTGAFIDFYVACSGFSDSVKYIIRGSNINGASNDVICNRSYTYFRFVYSAILSEWILINSNNGY
jgi:hypothetical protein